MDAQFRPIEERRAEMAAARAGRHVPATSSSDNRCWVCGRCGRAFPKKKGGVDAVHARLHSLVGQEVPPLWGEAAMNINALRIFLRVGLATSAATLVAAMLTDSDRTLVGMAGMAAVAVATIVHLWRRPLPPE